MPDNGTGASVATGRSGGLLARLADGILAVPGVARLEPTLSTSGPGMLLRPAHTDGLHVLLRGAVAEVDVNVITESNHQARDVTHEVRRCVASILTVDGYITGAVTVSVLSISP